MRTESCLIIGAGGHGRVVLDALLQDAPGIDVEVRDDSCSVTNLLGLAVANPAIPAAPLIRPTHIAIGANRVRREMAQLILARGARLHTVVHPQASLSPHARLGAGTFVAAQAVVAPGATVGDGVIVNHGAVIDHDCRVGDWSHIAPGAVLGGGSTVGQEVLIGSGAVVLPGIKIGDHAVIGAGAVVTRDVIAGESRVGVPARKTNG